MALVSEPPTAIGQLLWGIGLYPNRLGVLMLRVLPDAGEGRKAEGGGRGTVSAMFAKVQGVLEFRSHIRPAGH